MPDPASFTDEENWSGGFYELSIELGDLDHQGLQRALTALWRAASIDGCYGSRDHEPGEQAEVPCTVSSLATFGHLRGTVHLPNGHRVVCGCVILGGDEDPEWLDFYLPLGALARVDPRIGGFPFDSRSGEDSLVWRRPLDDWLAAVGTTIFREVPFRLGLIGFETERRHLLRTARRHRTGTALGGISAAGW
ncbi:hypothetical protein [Micromonospora sp. NBC_01796]|uniref:hypothetical protein n=1 Tax=Micromonospora sp. NBC_01796 TaxID=2975987 RepID=UPI002DD8917A|nr:hypothetical protein [Micromonospora sp. NBC_01796]WSA84501.1 hypothetical protein OIE47_29715 [Micromonospora sp. NBC_01796]